jgi:polysaccharide deacetylase family protein (PEP-CTERM system associated)
MNFSVFSRWRLDRPHQPPPTAQAHGFETILSFDVEEHHRIEAAAHLVISPALKTHYQMRLESSTQWLLEQLDRFGFKATFFIVGQIARSQPNLVRQIARHGHEVASHSWDHRRVHRHTPGSFRQDVRLSRDVLQQVTGQPVLGYRAPTFSIVATNAWALDVLAEEGFTYDSSIFPVHHDRYGVPDAPRAPFRVAGARHQILEMPPATLRLWGFNLPIGGGGYFRIFPLALLRRALHQIHSHCTPSVAMLYFHPWEFDADQFRLPLSRLSALRTYAGIGSSRSRIVKFLAGRTFVRAVDVAKRLTSQWDSLPTFSLAGNQTLQVRSR